MEKQTENQSTGTIPEVEGNAGDGGCPPYLRSSPPQLVKLKGEKTLFIGGAYDGQRKCLPQHNPNMPMHQVQGYVPGNNNASVFGPSCGITTFSYNIERIRDGHGNYYEVAVDPKVTNIIETLLKGYHYHRRDAGLRGCRRSRY